MRHRRLAAVIVMAGISIAAAVPAPARHSDPHCVATVHHPLGTDDAEVPVLVPVPADEPPTDVGSVKIFVRCRHGRG